VIEGLYVITDEELYPGRTHLMIAQAAIEGGARIIQIRDKTASDREFYEAAVAVRELCTRAKAKFFVNDRVHIAAAVGADGVNVGQSDLPVSIVREILGEKAIVGVSCDCIEEAVQAEKDGADYIGYGPVFATTTKLDTGPVSGLVNLQNVCEAVNIPVVAIGGIGLNNIHQIADAGATSAAVISAIVRAKDMKQTVIELIRRYGTRNLRGADGL
jgi:thiamine-phosphate pyrophosphorylase